MRCLQIEASPKKFQKVGVKVTGEFGFAFKTFCIGKHNLHSFIPNFGYFLNPFDNFNFSATIVFKLMQFGFELIQHEVMEFFR